jgi:phosphopantetheinyl transferase
LSNNCEILHIESKNRSTPVYYASARISGDRDETKNALAGKLLHHGGFMCIEETKAQRIKNDRYGCPQFDPRQSIALSFSFIGQRVWAAVAQTSALGIDVEAPESFRTPYPYDRAFQTDEFYRVSNFCADTKDAAALLWSCKEAAMKNRGTGFHLIDPRDVRILSCEQEIDRGYMAIVATPEKIPVIVMRERHLWLAFAVSE